MIQLHVEQCELTYEGAFVNPAFSLVDFPGKLCDLLLDALASFGCTGADLLVEKGEPGEWGVMCEVDELDARVTLHGDRIEIHCANFVTGTAANVATLLENLWSGLGGLSANAAPKTHSILFEAEVGIRGASYQEVLNRLARVPESLPADTETAVVYYLPAESNRGYGESSLVLNHSAEVERGLQVSATLVYMGESVKPAEAISAAKNRLPNYFGIWDSSGLRINVQKVALTPQGNARKRFRRKKSAAQPLAARGVRVVVPSRNQRRCKKPKCGAFAAAQIQPVMGSSPTELRPTRSPFRSLEQEWLRQHRAEYAGSWIALHGAHLVAQGSSPREVLAAARTKGYDLPLVVHIPSEPPLPFGGW
jgi:Family of unknown function (DUF5678)